MTDAKTLDGKLAIITGGGRGIGEAVAVAFAARGAKLVLGARTEVELRNVASRCSKEYDAQVMYRAVDVADPNAVPTLLGCARELGQTVDVLVNCAGIYGPIGRIDEVEPENWIRAIEVNLFGVFFACHAVLPEMIRNRRGKIINFSGGGATAPLPRFSAYGTSKAAVVRLTETLAEEVKEFNVQINAIAPGAVNTRMLDEVLVVGERAGQEFHKRALKQKEQGGVPPQLAANLAVFLASEQSGKLTGKLISAAHDLWNQWADRLDEINSTPMFTLRRLDPFTLKPLVAQLK